MTLPDPFDMPAQIDELNKRLRTAKETAASAADTAVRAIERIQELEEIVAELRYVRRVYGMSAGTRRLFELLANHDSKIQARRA